MYRLDYLANFLEADLLGDPSFCVLGLCSVDNPKPACITFLNSEKYLQKLLSSSIDIVLSSKEIEGFSGHVLIVPDPYVAYAKLSKLFDLSHKIEGIHSTAVVSPSARIGSNVSIGPFSVVEDDAVLEDGVSIGSQCVVGARSVIGKETTLKSGVVFYHDVQVGQFCTFHSNSVIGSDGFGNANQKGEWIKIYHTGKVVIGDRVEIGAGTCIDRGTLDDTEIDSNVVIDNLCHIAHNCKIGYGTAIAGGAVFAGSVRVGKYCMIGGQCVINGHIEIADFSQIVGLSGVVKSTEKGQIVSSVVPAMPRDKWLRTMTVLNRLVDFERSFKKLKKGFDALSKKGSGV